jgi:hypothetical protein
MSVGYQIYLELSHFFSTSVQGIRPVLSFANYMCVLCGSIYIYIYIYI